MIIREAIDKAYQSEQRTGSLKSYIDEQLPKMHHGIRLPEDGEPETLVAFLSRYISHVPDFLDALIDISKTAGIYSFVARSIKIAQSYFNDQPRAAAEESGLFALLDEAYFAHRLIEEINDKILVVCGIPFVPMDMALSNIIVHAVLGEQFANKLDLAVQCATEGLFEDFHELENPEFQAYVIMHKTSGWNDVLATWPCLAGDSAIQLDFSTQSNVISLH